MASSTIYTGTDGTLTLNGLADQTNTPITGASVTATLYNSTGAAVTNWSALTLADAGNGNYTYSYEAASVPSHGTYNLYIIAVKSGQTIQALHTIIVADLQV